MTTILVTGIDGFTGRYFTASLSRMGHEIHGIVRDPIVELDGASALHVANLADAGRLAEILREVAPQKVVHLAGIAFVAHGDAEAIYTTNVVGTRNVLEAVLHAGRTVDTVLLASSANVYGNSTAGILHESTPFAPANDYGVSKVAMEYVASLYSDRLPIIITRPFNYTGIGQDESFLLPKIVNHVRRKAPLIELGNLDVARDFSDVRTIVEYYRRLLECPSARGGTFNVCSGQVHTLRQILDMIRALSGHDFEVRVNSSFVRANEVKTLCGSREKLLSAVGALQEIPLMETLRWMLGADSQPSSR
jgi:GDP-6-deoxy-D-talose 4-dehydrogenase